MKILLISLLCLPILSLAQRLSISPSIGYHNTSLLNPEDKVGISYVPVISSYSIKIGADVSYAISKKTNGLTAISSGIFYAPIIQNFKEKNPPTYSVSRSANTKLNYLQIPLLACFQIKASKKLQITAKTGLGLNYLVAYKVQYTDLVLVSGSTTKTTVYGLDIHNNTYNQLLANEPLNASIDKWYYNKIVWCGIAHIGANYIVNNKIKIASDIQYCYGLNDVENKTNITNTVTNGFYTGFKTTENQYEKYFSFMGKRSVFPKTPRKVTNLQSIGLQISIQYNL